MGFHKFVMSKGAVVKPSGVAVLRPCKWQVSPGVCGFGGRCKNSLSCPRFSPREHPQRRQLSFNFFLDKISKS